MKLCKVPKNTKYIKFINTSDRNCKLFISKEFFALVPAKSIQTVESMRFFCQDPVLKYFPQCEIYSSFKILVDFG